MTALTASHPPSTHPKYRADIDGLRALAVLSVVGFHAFPGMVKGGFIGVDIFFVISGFLISTILFDNLARGSFSLAEFYGRRVKRIFPALFLVLLSCYVLGWYVLLAEEYQQLGKHLAGGAGFIANFILKQESGYFDEAAEAKPLLHLWSLGIEEQFYIIWPLLLWAVWQQRHRLWGIIFLLAVVSFGLNLSLVQRDPIGTFYAPYTRFWELLIGAMLAYATLHKPALLAVLTPRRANGVSLLGGGLLAMGMALLNKGSVFPGAWALLPTLGAALIIAAGPRAWFNRTVLAHRIVVWFGLISFPLYLWHWPLLSFAYIIESEVPSRGVRLAAVALSVVLAWLTYRFVEKPIRFGATHSRAETAGLVLGVAIVGGLGLHSYTHGGLEGTGYRTAEKSAYAHYFDNSLPEQAYFKKIRLAEYYRDGCNFYDLAQRRQGKATQVPVPMLEASCTVRQPTQPHAVLIWGDSHAQQFYAGLRENLPADWQVLQVASSGCAPSLTATQPSTVDYCQQSNWFALKTIAASPPDVVLVGQEQGHQRQTMQALAAKLHHLGVKKVVFAGATPHWTAPLPRLILRKLWHDTPQRTMVGVNQEVLASNRALAAEFKNTAGSVFVDVQSVFCNAAGCLTYFDTQDKTSVTTWDYGHLTPAASDYLAKMHLAKVILEGELVPPTGLVAPQ